MRRLIWVFAGHTNHIVGNLMSRLNFNWEQNIELIIIKMFQCQTLSSASVNNTTDMEYCYWTQYIFVKKDCLWIALEIIRSKTSVILRQIWWQLNCHRFWCNQCTRLAPVLKIFFINVSYQFLVASLTLIAIRVRIAVSKWYDTLMKKCFKDWRQSTNVLAYFYLTALTQRITLTITGSDASLFIFSWLVSVGELFKCTCFCNATSDWITTKNCDNTSCDILSDIVRRH